MAKINKRNKTKKKKDSNKKDIEIEKALPMVQGKHEYLKTRIKNLKNQLEESQQIANVGSWEWDVLKNEVIWSKQLFKIYGLSYKKFKATYENFLKRIHPNDRKRVDIIIKTAFKNKKPFNFLHRIVRPDLTVRMLHGLGRVTVDKKGTVVKMAGTGQDITTEYAEKIRNERYFLTAEGSKDGFIDWANVNKDAQWWSPRLYKMLGYNEKDITPTYSNFINHVHPEDVKLLETKVETHFKSAGRIPFELEYRLRKKNGDYIIVIARGKTLYKNNKPSRMSGSLRDITEKKKIMEQIGLFEKEFEQSPNPRSLISYEDKTPKIIRVNESYLNFYGYSKNELLGKNPNVVKSNFNDSKFFKSMWKQILNPKKGHWSGEFSNICKSGVYVSVSASITTIFDNNGVAKYFLEQHTDITKLKEAQEHAKERDKSYKSLFEQAAVGIAKLTIDGQIIIANQKLSQISSYPVDELIGKRFNKITQTTEMKLDFKAIVEVLEGNEKSVLVTKGYYKRGDNKIWINITLSLIPSGPDKESHFIAIIEHITPEVIAHQKLEKAYADLKLLDKEKDQFISTTSHELKSPLVPIMGYSELILEGELGKITDKQREALGIIHENVSNLSILIEDFLDLSRLDLKKLKIFKRRENIFRIIKEVIDSYRNFTQKYNAKINLKSKQKIFAHCDELRIRQITSNLIKNAIIHRKNNNKINQITISITQKNKYIEVIVNDHGRGIAKSEIKNLFNKFYRTEQAVRSPTKGTGLGLVIVKGLVELHGGRITLQSKRGKGSSFKFSIPKK
jgi:PAS domain S-box-containing protein